MLTSSPRILLIHSTRNANLGPKKSDKSTAESTPGETKPLLHHVWKEQAGSMNQEAHALETWEDVTIREPNREVTLAAEIRRFLSCLSAQ